ncbi:hypothetical protein MKX01_011589, partial [Papaver californicum]
FGEASPEARKFNSSVICFNTKKFIVYNYEGHVELMDFVHSNSLNDGDEFRANILRVSSRHKVLAMHILEVRSAYCKQYFEWNNLNKLAVKIVDDSNTRIMRDYVLETINRLVFFDLIVHFFHRFS